MDTTPHPSRPDVGLPPDPRLEDRGPWGGGPGRVLRDLVTGRRVVFVPLPGGADMTSWDRVVARLRDVEASCLVAPSRTVGDTERPGLLYEPPEDLREGESFSRHLEQGGAADQRETLRMAAGAARALCALHDAGIVLRRLSLHDVLRTDSGWALMLQPSGAAAIASDAELPSLARADLVLVCAAVVTVLTGRRPVPGRDRPRLVQTHPLLPVAAADALDTVLDAAASGAEALSFPASAQELACVLEGALAADAPVEAAPAPGRRGRAAVPAGDDVGVEAAGDGVPATHGPETSTDAPTGRAVLSTPRRRGDPSSGARHRLGSLAQQAAPGPSARPGAGMSAPDVLPGPHRRVRRGRRTVGPGTAAAAAVAVIALVGVSWSVMGAAPWPGAVETVEQGPAAQADAPRAASAPDPVPTRERPALASTAPSDPQQAAGGPEDPRAAAAALVQRRGDALRTRDEDVLSSVYVAGAPDLTTDREQVDDLAALGPEVFADLRLDLVDARLIDRGRSAASAEDGGRVGVAGTVRAEGRGLDGDTAGWSTVSQEVVIVLERDEEGAWRIADVTPEEARRRESDPGTARGRD